MFTYVDYDLLVVLEFQGRWLRDDLEYHKKNFWHPSTKEMI